MIIFHRFMCTATISRRFTITVPGSDCAALVCSAGYSGIADAASHGNSCLDFCPVHPQFAHGRRCTRLQRECHRPGDTGGATAKGRAYD